jgi:hypothetical protein
MNPERPSGPHPAAESLLRAQRAPKDPVSRAVLDHAALCAACSEELAAIEAFTPRPDPFGSEARRANAAWARFSGAPAARRSRFLPALAMAAAVCLAAAVALLLPHRETDGPRGGATSAMAFFPSGEISAPPAEFRFPRSGNAMPRVSVFDAERRYTWTSEPSPPGAPIAYPETERAKLRPGTTYTWVVLGGGTLPAQAFTLQR